MIEIIPAILPKNYEDLKNKVALVRGVVAVVQVDICDGVFVKTRSWPFENTRQDLVLDTRSCLDIHFQKILNEEEGMPFWQDIDFELDLMVADAVENFDIYTKLGPKRIIFHLEAYIAEALLPPVGGSKASADSGFKNFLEGIDKYVRDSIQVGVAINPSTPIENIFSIVPFIDFVQCMGIAKIGYQGEDFDQKCLDYIKTLKEKFPDIIISVDGGVNLETAPEIIKAGASRLVAGSAIFNTDDIIGTIERFRNL